MATRPFASRRASLTSSPLAVWIRCQFFVAAAAQFDGCAAVCLMVSAVVFADLPAPVAPASDEGSLDKGRINHPSGTVETPPRCA